MRIYKVMHKGHTVQFARSFEFAKRIVQEDDPKARKVSSADYTEYSNGFEIHALDLNTDKDGILTLLNSLVPLKLIEENPTEQVVEETAEAVTPSHDRPWDLSAGLIPATAYDGTGIGTCLHCNKTIGYVGGFPRGSPPDAIRDKSLNRPAQAGHH